MPLCFLCVGVIFFFTYRGKDFLFSEGYVDIRPAGLDSEDFSLTVQLKWY